MVSVSVSFGVPALENAQYPAAMTAASTAAPSPERALRSARRRRDSRDCGGVLIGGALLALQIGADVRGTLIPELSILLERLQHDLFEAFGQVRSKVAVSVADGESRPRRRHASANAGRSVAISYNTNPNEKRSVRASTSSPRSCSATCRQTCRPRCPRRSRVLGSRAPPLPRLQAEREGRL